LLARPENRLIQVLFSSSAGGSLARRLFYGLTLIPTVLIGLAVLAIQFRIVAQGYSIGLLVLRDDFFRPAPRLFVGKRRRLDRSPP
jgi:hypothetical protein